MAVRKDGWPPRFGVVEKGGFDSYRGCVGNSWEDPKPKKVRVKPVKSHRKPSAVGVGCGMELMFLALALLAAILLH